MDDHLIRTREVAKLLGNVCPRTVRRLWEAGTLPRPIKIGKLNMHRRSDVVAILERHRGSDQR